MTSPPSLLHVTGTWQDIFCQLNSAEQPNCTRAPLLQALGLFPIVWAHVSKWGVAYLRGNLLFIPPHRTVQDLYSVGRQRLGRQKGGKDLVERWVNANERWQRAARTGTWTVWGRLGSIGRALAGFPPSIVRPSAFLSRPPPTSKDRTSSRTLTQRSSGVPSRTLENVETFWHVKNFPWPSAFSDDPWRPPTTYSGLLMPLLWYELQRQPTFVCVLSRFHER